MNYRERRKKDCQELFSDFELDLKGCRKPEQVKQILALAREGYFSREIAEKLGVTPKSVQKVFRRYNFPRLYNFSPPRREERPNWRGGVKTTTSGHLYQRVIDHPHKTKHGGYVAVHRLVIEKKLGRYLLPGEVVHHLDDNPRNNHPDNLELYSNNAEHLRETLKGKCPKWSEEGMKALDKARRRKRRTWKGAVIEPIPYL